MAQLATVISESLCQQKYICDQYCVDKFRNISDLNRGQHSETLRLR